MAVTSRRLNNSLNPGALVYLSHWDIIGLHIRYLIAALVKYFCSSSVLCLRFTARYPDNIRPKTHTSSVLCWNKLLPRQYCTQTPSP